MTRRGAGEGSIRERTDGTYEARVVVEGKRLSLYGHTRREVQQKLSEAKRLAEQGKLVGHSRQRWLSTSTTGSPITSPSPAVPRRWRATPSMRSGSTSTSAISGSIGSKPLTSSTATLSS